MSGNRHLRLVPAPPKKPQRARLTFGMPDHPLARTSDGDDLATDLERIRLRLIAKGGIGR